MVSSHRRTSIYLLTLHAVLGSIHARSGSTLAAHLPGLQQLVAEKQVRGDTSAGRNTIPQHAEGIEDTLEGWVHWLASGEVQADDGAVAVLVLQGSHYNDGQLEGRAA